MGLLAKYRRAMEAGDSTKPPACPSEPRGPVGKGKTGLCNELGSEAGDFRCAQSPRAREEGSRQSESSLTGTAVKIRRPVLPAAQA